MKIRCSALAQIMTNGRGGGLSVGCQTYIKQLAKEYVFGIQERVYSKQMAKGNQCEDDSISLLNSVLFESYAKNEDSKENDWITGTCDIHRDGTIRDIKTSWSYNTFPAFVEDAEKAAKKSGYEWQVRGYMWLWGAERAYIDYCLVDTPEDLCVWEIPQMHEVSHLPPELRVTTVGPIERDQEIEKQIAERVEQCREYLKEKVIELKNKHEVSL